MRKPWLWLPPKLAHDILPWALPIAAKVFPSSIKTNHPLKWRNLHFENPLGIAGGVDKSGRSLLAWQSLGCGFVEVGTITPKGQEPNPGCILDRSIERKAVWNKMGFPNEGAEKIQKRLEKIKPHLRVPLFINVGKNRTTDNSHAHLDYMNCMTTLKDSADCFVINISSPNTKGLRELSNKDYLSSFVGPIVEHKHRMQIKTPLLMKLSPDMPTTELHMVLDTSLELGIDGWILTNTTASRPNWSLFSQEGGLSGAPLKALSVENLRNCIHHLGSRKNDKLLISAGGISSTEDVQERLRLGADLVQIYSALIFEGPRLFQKILKTL